MLVHDVINGGTTFMLPNETFTLVYFDYAESFSKFMEGATQAVDEIQNRRLGLPTQTRRRRAHTLHHLAVDLVHQFLSCARWGREDSVPKISFGKFVKEKDRTLMPFSVEVHHSLMDGLHVGRYIARIEEMLAQPKPSSTKCANSSFVILLLLIARRRDRFRVYRFTRKPLPTPIGWKAHVTTVAGDGSPFFATASSRIFRSIWCCGRARRNDLCC